MQRAEEVSLQSALARGQRLCCSDVQQEGHSTTFGPEQTAVVNEKRRCDGGAVVRG